MTGEARTKIVLSDSDRELCHFAAEFLMGLLDPGPPRERAAERLMQRYRDDLAAALPGADPDMLDDIALTFGGALLLEMERVGLAYAPDAELGHA